MVRFFGGGLHQALRVGWGHLGSPQSTAELEAWGDAGQACRS